MRGAYLPGGRRVELREVPTPRPGRGQVLVRVMASGICGSDLRAIYREHLGTGPEAYQNVIAGHEPAGIIIEAGPECRRFAEGDRVALYHIAGCGLCADCRAGYMISCTSPLRAAYGWQRDGGHADYLLAEESTCIALPDAVSYLDGAWVACSLGTAYEALWRCNVSGRDAVLVVGLGPVGLGAAAVARAMGAPMVAGVDPVPARREGAARLGVVDHAFDPTEGATDVRELTGGGVEVAIDCSGSAAGRALAIRATRRRGRVALVGEGGRLEVDASPDLIHQQLTVHGSWVTSVGRMQELVDLLPRWGLQTDRLVSDRYGLDDVAEAYARADEGNAGKVAIVTDP